MNVLEKFVIKEARLLDSNGNKTLKVKLMDEEQLQQLFPNEVNEEDVRGGYSNVKKQLYGRIYLK
ncbi:hypothetical protein [Paenibacillus xylaniclasticus]|uniref:hypothetical protein n=1 Tax=Paenibacillus xylaniclasticus TaxID=588083 RepID=UPI000FDAEB72|nr:MULTISPECIES: hypothetical protein [Paenibacillus]GFN32477.1 hypothetical protein PCURB6_27370 [Paenibacillus curdlanolyticus]